MYSSSKRILTNLGNVYQRVLPESAQASSEVLLQTVKKDFTGIKKQLKAMGCEVNTPEEAHSVLTKGFIDRGVDKDMEKAIKETTQIQKLSKNAEELIGGTDYATNFYESWVIEDLPTGFEGIPPFVFSDEEPDLDNTVEVAEVAVPMGETVTQEVEQVKEHMEEVIEQDKENHTVNENKHNETTLEKHIEEEMPMTELSQLQKSMQERNATTVVHNNTASKKLTQTSKLKDNQVGVVTKVDSLRNAENAKELRKTKGWAFLGAYLLGVDAKVLQNKFYSEFVYSGSLESFKDVENAELLRLLVRIRNKVLLRYNQTYYEEVTLDCLYEKEGQDDLKDDLYEAEQVGFNVIEVMRRVQSIALLVNELNKEIKYLAPKVLETFNIPYGKEVGVLFMCQNVTTQTLHQLATKLVRDIRKLPLQTPIAKSQKVTTSLRALFNSDYEFFKGAFEIAEKTLTFDEDICVKGLDWGTLATIDKGQKSITPKIPTLGKATFYVDCDNVKMEFFLAFIEKFSESKLQNGKYKIKLFVDEVASDIWNEIEHILQIDIPVEVIAVPRIKSQKSVVDVVIAHEVTKDSIMNKASNKNKGTKMTHCIVSSDSDFYGLLTQDMEMGVFYNSATTSSDYITYLKTNQVVSYDLGQLDLAELNVHYMTRVYAYYILEKFKEVPMGEWGTEETLDSIVEMFVTKAYATGALLKTTVTDILKDIIENMTISKEGKNIVLEYNGIQKVVTI